MKALISLLIFTIVAYHVSMFSGIVALAFSYWFLSRVEEKIKF